MFLIQLKVDDIEEALEVAQAISEDYDIKVVVVDDINGGEVATIEAQS